LKKLISLLAAIVMGVPAYAAWFLDRDNTMVDADDDVGAAMAVILGPTGTVTQAIQVCSGVYLATAHGALDSPIIARDNGRSVSPAGKASMRLIAYPMSRENLTEALDEVDYISPRLRDPSLWENGRENTDYVFITVDDPPRPQSFVTPLFMTPDQLIDNADRLEVFMYRGKSRYQGAKTGGLDYNEDIAISDSDVPALIRLYQQPQRVVQSCEFLPNGMTLDGYVAHDSPTEQGASGAPYISQFDGMSYLVGINTRGGDGNVEEFSALYAGASSILMSSAFCADYETACGRPCTSLSDVMTLE